MRRWLMSHLSIVMRMLVLLATVALLALLSWSITTSDILGAVAAGAGLAVDIVIAGTTVLAPDDMRSQATERTLRVASATLSHMAGGLTSKNCLAVCQLLLSETTAAAIGMTDLVGLLSMVGEDHYSSLEGEPNSEAVREVIESGRVQTFADLGPDEWSTHAEKGHRHKPLPYAIIAPLKVSDRVVGTIKFYYRRGRDIDRTQLTIVRGLAELLSTQLSVYELDRQAELTARAEVKALQAQINPHFLFNALNTMAALTRTDPAKARELLREFSVYYRRTLESSQSLMSLSEELAQTRRYLKIEKARFGENRILEEETVEPGCEDVMVPGFIVQPIVENAVRHAMREEGALHIDIQVVRDAGDVMIAVADDGLGMSEEAAARLVEAARPAVPGGSNRGAGIALRNVADRLERFYGAGSGVEIMSSPGEGTCVTLRLVGVAPEKR